MSVRRTTGIAALCALLAVAPPASADAFRDALARERARSAAPWFPLQRFLAVADVDDVRLAPEGRRAAFLRDDGRRRSLWLADLATGASTRLLARTDATTVAWTSDSRLLVLQTPRRVIAVATRAPARSSVLTPLDARAGRALVGMDPYRPGIVVRTRRRVAGREAWSLLHVDMQGRERVLYRGLARPNGYALDPLGRLAYVQLVEGDALVTYATTAHGRSAALRCEALERCELLGLRRRDGALLLKTDLVGGRDALARLVAHGRVEVLHQDPRRTSDLDDVVLQPGTLEPVFASYRSDGPALYALTPQARIAFDAITRSLPDTDFEVQVGTDPRYWLVRDRDARTQAPRWFTFDASRGQLALLVDARLRIDRHASAPIPASTFARRIGVDWTASDGMRLHGFLSVPPGRDVARVPLVALVHGGPWSHVDPGFSLTVQLLVNRGYAVFEPAFRGSTGFGRAYMLAARGDFGNGRVQQDIVDGVEYLLHAGVGDASRVAIAGASFGGYATLLGVTFRPDLFKAGVAFVPPPDFAWNVRWIQRSAAAAELSPIAPIDRWMRWLEVDPANTAWMERLRAQAPLANGSKLRVPLLLIAGGADRRVSITGVIEYAARLRRAGRPVELLIDPTAGHSNNDPVAREATLYLTVTRLARVLGPPSRDVPSRKAALYLRENMRL